MLSTYVFATLLAFHRHFISLLACHGALNGAMLQVGNLSHWHATVTLSKFDLDCVYGYV